MNKSNWIKGLLVVVAAAFLAAPIGADEITDEIDVAVKQYKAGNYSEAVSALEFAAQQIRHKRVADVLRNPTNRPHVVEKMFHAVLRDDYNYLEGR